VSPRPAPVVIFLASDDARRITGADAPEFDGRRASAASDGWYARLRLARSLTRPQRKPPYTSGGALPKAGVDPP
jgi:hypothetical protein